MMNIKGLKTILTTVFIFGSAFSTKALADPVLVNFPATPTPPTIAIPSGGFTIGQTFQFNHIWDNTWDRPVQVTLGFNLIEDDPVFSEVFPFQSTFVIPANTNNFSVTSNPTLTAAQLNSANDFPEFDQLEFSLQRGTFTFTHVPEPTTILSSVVALGFGIATKKLKSKKQKLN
ncbi:PEP-CTERM sorting domain-containing protein [Nostoc sp. CHAB 5844]|nr:PEP-CTERM sorting domain-containing protein [Nostoc sp. CHAB 5844]